MDLIPGILASGKTFTHNFHTDGIIQYYCHLHPTMLGEIIVVIFYLIISFLVDTFQQIAIPCLYVIIKVSPILY